MSLAAKAIMLWSVDICGSRRPIFTLSSRLTTCSFNFSTSSSAQATSCFDEDCDDFLPWLEKKAGTEISSVISIGKSAYGRSLYASKSIEVGDFMLRIPLIAQLSPSNLLPEINDILSDKVGEVAKLAVVVLIEQKMGLHSDWAPYISRLPPPEEMHNTEVSKEYYSLQRSLLLLDILEPKGVDDDSHKHVISSNNVEKHAHTQ